MSFPNIPDVDAAITIPPGGVISLLLASVAFEELGLAHILNAEAEKVQYILGTLDGQYRPENPPTLAQLLLVDRSVNQTLRNIIKKEMLLQFKLEDILQIELTGGGDGGAVEAGSAWSVGTPFGHGNAQYTTLDVEEDEKTVVLGLGSNNIPVGSVEITREDDTLSVTVSTDDPYVMNLIHLYVDDTPPTNSAPGSFPYRYPETDPSGFFTTHTFNIDISGLTGTLYISAHAQIYIQA